jgi:hypothetical protein
MHGIDWQPPPKDLVRKHTAAGANERIDRRTRAALDEAAASPERIRARLAQLDREWDIDRALMLNFALLGGTSAALTMRSLAQTGRLGGWGALFWTQAAFLAYHALRKWCPPMPVFRRLGYRSHQEISAERVALVKRLLELEGNVGADASVAPDREARPDAEGLH